MASTQLDRCFVKLSKRVEAKSLKLTNIKNIRQKVEKLYDVLYQKSQGFPKVVCFRPGCPYHHVGFEQRRTHPLQTYLPLFFNALLLLHAKQED
jgi:hypothetical protein